MLSENNHRMISYQSKLFNDKFQAEHLDYEKNFDMNILQNTLENSEVDEQKFAWKFLRRFFMLPSAFAYVF